jgi:hypothetical protein
MKTMISYTSVNGITSSNDCGNVSYGWIVTWMVCYGYQGIRLYMLSHCRHAENVTLCFFGPVRKIHNTVEILTRVLTIWARYDYLPFFYSRVFEAPGSERKVWWQFYGDNGMCFLGEL